MTPVMARHVMLGIDSLFDTRITVYSMFDDRGALKQLEGDWFSRYSEDWIDNFPNVNGDDVRRLLHSGDANIMLNSQATKILDFINQFIYGSSSEKTTPDNYTDFGLYVNLHPYTLSDAVREELRAVIQETLPVFKSITFVNYSIKQLTPAVIRQRNIHLHVTYWCKEWLNHHADELKKQTLASYFLVGPKLVPKAEIDNPEVMGFIDKMRQDNFDIFQFLEYSYCMFLSVRFIDVEFFSTMYHHTPKHKAGEALG